MKQSISNVVLLIGFFILLLSIPFGVYVAAQRNSSTTLSSRATSANSAFLYLWPASSLTSPCLGTANQCAKTKYEVILNTGGLQASGADIVINYDPKIMQVFNNRIYPGAVDDNGKQLYQIFDYYREGSVNPQTGMLTIKARGEFTGERGVVASFFLTGKAVGTTKLDLLQGGSGCVVYDQNGLNNILGGADGADLEVK